MEDEERLVEVVEALMTDQARRHERVLRGRQLFVADAADLVERASGRLAPVAAASAD